jgi:hypothetical protein
MPPHIIRNGPLNVLVSLADPDLDVAQFLPALEPHYALVCSTPAQAVAAAKQFEPDIVLIDCRAPDPLGLVQSVLQAVGRPNIVFVAMLSATGPAPIGFQFSLPIPAMASDLEAVLWQIGHGSPISPGHVPEYGTEKIG